MAGEDVFFELAARLGSIVTFDRHGEVIWLDSMESGLAKWAETAIGANSAIALSNASARYGYWSAKLTAGAGATAFARLDAYAAYPLLSKLGFEIAFTVDADAGSISWAMALYNGTQLVKPEVRYTPATGYLEYVDADSVWRKLATGLSLRTGDKQYHVLKLVWDTQKSEYCRVILDSVQYDMVGVAARTAADATAACLGVLVWLSSDGANISSVYIDGAIITQNEP